MARGSWLPLGAGVPERRRRPTLPASALPRSAPLRPSPRRRTGYGDQLARGIPRSDGEPAVRVIDELCSRTTGEAKGSQRMTPTCCSRCKRPKWESARGGPGERGLGDCDGVQRLAPTAAVCCCKCSESDRERVPNVGLTRGNRWSRGLEPFLDGDRLLDGRRMKMAILELDRFRDRLREWITARPILERLTVVGSYGLF